MERVSKLHILHFFILFELILMLIFHLFKMYM